MFAEFEDIPKMKSKCDCTVASQEDNKEKNRWGQGIVGKERGIVGKVIGVMGKDTGIKGTGSGSYW